jgi:hypothetical protein
MGEGNLSLVDISKDSSEVFLLLDYQETRTFSSETLSQIDKKKMSYIVLLLLIILGTSNASESLEFRLIDCIENETSSTHILEITNFNETCIKVNRSTLNGSEIYYYVFPGTTDGAQLHLKTENCSTSIPDLHLTLCDDEDINQNSTDIIQTFAFNNLTNLENNTGPDVYENIHWFDQEEEDDDN